MTNGITIRHAISADVISYRELRLEALRNHPTAFGADYEENLHKPLSYWEERLNENAEAQAKFVAEQSGQLIGMAGIFRSMSKKSYHSADLVGVYVKPEWRGKNISEMLIRACLNWAAEKNITIVKLGAVTDNLPAIRVYERCGFKIYGTEPQALQHEGIYYDEHLMAIEIPHPVK